MIFPSIKFGIAQMWTNKRMVLIFYLVNLLFGLILMLPFRATLDKFVGYSLMGTKLAGRFDMDFLFEFLIYNRTMTTVLMGLILVVPAIYWLVELFLSGGAFAIFSIGQTYTPAIFWGNAAKYFGRFIRLILWSLPVIAILFCLQFLWTTIERIFFGSDPYQYISYWGDWIKVGLRHISILLFGIILDYSRIYTIITDERKILNALLKGIKFAFENFFYTFGLAFLLFILGAIVLVIYNPIANSLSVPNTFIIILLLLVQQIYIFFRMMLRLTLYSSQLQLFNFVSAKQKSNKIEFMDDLEIEGKFA